MKHDSLGRFTADLDAPRLSAEERRARNAEGAKRWRLENPEKNREAMQRWVEANPGWSKAALLRRKYNVSVVSWLAMFHFQGERCACCGSKDPGAKGWATDHEHNTHPVVVRGVICQKCNIMLGRLGDTLSRVRDNASTYTSYLERAS